MRMLFYSTLRRQLPLRLSTLGLLFIVMGCGSETPDSANTEPSPSLPPLAIAPNSGTPSGTPFESSMVPSEGRTLPPALPVPQLIPPTSSKVHTTTLSSSAGRPDPFAPLAPSNVIVTARPSAPSVTPPAAPALPAPPATMPTVSVSALPPPTLQPGIPGAAPTQPVAPTKPLAETIEISGFLEVGGNTNLIVFVPGEHTSRPARVGEYLGNGDVLIKRVMPQPSGDVLVILEQGGVEYQRSVGSNPSTVIGSL